MNCIPPLTITNILIFLAIMGATSFLGGFVGAALKDLVRYLWNKKRPS